MIIYVSSHLNPFHIWFFLKFGKNFFFVFIDLSIFSRCENDFCLFRFCFLANAKIYQNLFTVLNVLYSFYRSKDSFTRLLLPYTHYNGLIFLFSFFTDRSKSISQFRLTNESEINMKTTIDEFIFAFYYKQFTIIFTSLLVFAREDENKIKKKTGNCSWIAHSINSAVVRFFHQTQKYRWNHQDTEKCNFIL